MGRMSHLLISAGIQLRLYTTTQQSVSNSCITPTIAEQLEPLLNSDVVGFSCLLTASLVLLQAACMVQYHSGVTIILAPLWCL